MSRIPYAGATGYFCNVNNNGNVNNNNATNTRNRTAFGFYNRQLDKVTKRGENYV